MARTAPRVGDAPRPAGGPASSARSLAAGALLALQLLAALAWWALSPRGFPPGHPQWWANQAAPWPLALLAAAGLALLLRGRTTAARASLGALAALWASAALAGALTFPASGPRAALPALCLAGLLALCARGLGPAPPARLRWPGLALALLLGALLPRTQRAPAPSTRPAGEPAPAALVSAVGVLGAPQGDLGRVDFSCPGLSCSAWPLLTFVSRSPDGCWTLLAPRAARLSPPPRLVAWRQEGPGRAARWEGPDGALALLARADDRALEVETATTLAAPVFAHLVSYARLALNPARPEARLTLVLSPCPGLELEPAPFDYPVGRPLRLACLDASGTLRVLEASSGEKGPFRELGRGPLAQGAPLLIEVRLDGRPTARLVFLDWSAQASTELSPTAGWGLPQNALCWWRDGPTVHLELELAATSVGRGFHSVGHAAGTYRGRLRIEALP